MPRLLRINAGAGPEYVVERDGEVRKLVGDVFGDWQEGLRLPDGLEGARVLSPVLPSKIVAVGLNYRAHAAEQGKPLPPEPLIFDQALDHGNRTGGRHSHPAGRGPRGLRS